VAFIFNNMLRKLTSTYQPEWVAAVFESEGPTLREQEFAAYKANRLPRLPISLNRFACARLLAALRIPVLEYPGFERMTSSGPSPAGSRNQVSMW